MKITKQKITKLLLTELQGLDPVKVFIENTAPGQGQITITCYGKAWTFFWGAMGDMTLEEFFCSANVHYIANKLSEEDPEIVDVDKMREQAARRGIECHRDDPENDYEFLSEMYGPDMMDWHDSMPKTENHKYRYICRIIEAVKQALNEMAVAA